MKTAYRKKFLKELAKIPEPFRSRIEIIAFEEIPHIKSIFESHKIIRLKGYPNYFKVRIGDYRIGIKQENNLLIFERVMHRKDIYKFYP